jgi:hypothetical protein
MTGGKLIRVTGWHGMIPAVLVQFHTTSRARYACLLLGCHTWQTYLNQKSFLFTMPIGKLYQQNATVATVSKEQTDETLAYLMDMSAQ